MFSFKLDQKLGNDSHLYTPRREEVRQVAWDWSHKHQLPAYHTPAPVCDIDDHYQYNRVT